MAAKYDIKWKNDLKMYMSTFKSFILEGNVNDLQAICEGFDMSFEEFFGCPLFDRNALHD